MALGLDLSGSRAKLQRAGEHLAAFDSELPVLRNTEPISLRVTEVDPDTGWCEVYGGYREAEEPRLAVVGGDYVQNLRAALDYIVTALAGASQIDVRSHHGFPIYEKKRLFEKEVGTDARTVKGGPLHDIKHGIGLIRSFQPYRHKPDPYAHPLSLLNRFSNTDKHRQPFQIVGLPAPGKPPQLHAEFGDGVLIDQWQAPRFELPVGNETKLAAFQFAAPYPTEVVVTASGFFEWMLGTPALPPRYKLGALITRNVLDEMLDCVSRVIEEAAKL